MHLLAVFMCLVFSMSWFRCRSTHRGLVVFVPCSRSDCVHDTLDSHISAAKVGRVSQISLWCMFQLCLLYLFILSSSSSLSHSWSAERCTERLSWTTCASSVVPHRVQLSLTVRLCDIMMSPSCSNVVNVLQISVCCTFWSN